MKRQYIILLLFLFISSCGQRVASSLETSLFPEPKKGKWWIAHVVFTDAEGNYHHQSALLSSETVDEKTFVSFFSSQWNAQDSVYYAGTSISDKTVLNSNKKFPLLIAPDSIWNFKLDRKKLSVQTKRQNQSGDTSLIHIEDYYFDQRATFNVSAVAGIKGMYIMSPLPVRQLQDEIHTSAAKGFLFLSVIDNKEIFFNTAKHSSVVWIDIWMKSGKKLNILCNVNKAADIAMHSCTEWNQQGQQTAQAPYAMKCSEPISNLQQVNGKVYPLNYEIIDPATNATYIVSPVLETQLVQAQGRSCWMGAIDVTDKNTGEKVGAGNMIIFKQ